MPRLSRLFSAIKKGVCIVRDWLIARFAIIRLKIVTWARHPVQYSWTLAIFQGAAIDIASYYVRVPPDSGVAIGFLAFAAVIMTVRVEAPWTRTEKMAWIILAAVLMVIELRAIQQDHDDQIAKFKNITDGITASINLSRKQFKESQDKALKTLKTTHAVAELSKSNLDAMMGTDSYPCIVPQMGAVSELGIPLFLWNKGTKNDLTGVEVKIYSQEQFLTTMGGLLLPSVNLGTINPIWGKPIPETLRPVPDKTGVAIFTADIWAQNGFYSEVIQFRKGKANIPLAYRYWMLKQVVYEKKIGEIPEGARGGEKMEHCWQPEWSDDIILKSSPAKP